MLTIPPHWHWQVEESFKAAWPPTVTEVEPGVQGADVIGMHGCGVSVPMAAAVAAATCGLLGDMHMPKVAMFTIGFESATHAAVMLEPLTWFTGSTESCEGALPIVQERLAPWTTRLGMGPTLRVR
jgi:hypothetical protein